jgi:NADPH:quinone reductase-like Zn-dependent oxidoreductase
MKAALIARYGRNDLVTVAETAIPAFGSMDLLVQVHAASVNPVLVSVEFTSRQSAARFERT